MATVKDVLGHFDENRESVRALMNFDAEVLEVAIGWIERLNEKWKAFLIRDAPIDPTGKVPEPNARYTADALLTQLRGIRGHGSLKARYDLILNQCVVLLVSFFGSAAHELCIALVARALREDRNPALLEQQLKVSVGDLRSPGLDWDHLVARSIVDSAGASFQDMRSLARAFRDLCGFEPKQDKSVNTIIMAQAARHAIVHNGARVDQRLLKQVEAAHPRDVLKQPIEGTQIRFGQADIELAADAMRQYLAVVAANAL